MDESYVQVGPDSTGKQIRNLKITERSVDIYGTETFNDRYVQVLAIVDAVSGNPVDFDSRKQLEVLGQILIELRVLNLAFFEQTRTAGMEPGRLADQFGSGGSI
jgi:hypothetical protein